MGTLRWESTQSSHGVTGKVNLYQENMNSKDLLYKNLDDPNSSARKEAIGHDTRPPPSLYYMGERREPMLHPPEDPTKSGDLNRDVRYNQHLQLIGDTKSLRETTVPYTPNLTESAGAVDLKLRNKELSQPQNDDTKTQVLGWSDSLDYSAPQPPYTLPPGTSVAPVQHSEHPQPYPMSHYNPLPQYPFHENYRDAERYSGHVK